MTNTRKFLPRFLRRDVPYRPYREERDQAGAYRLVFEFFRTYIWPFKYRFILYLILSALVGVATYLMAYYGRVVVDDILVIAPPAPSQSTVAHPFSREEGLTMTQRRVEEGAVSEAYHAKYPNTRPPHAGRKLFVLFIIYLATVVALNTGHRMAIRARHRVAQYTTIHLREDLHRKIMSLSSGFHQGTTPGRLMSRILSDVEMVQSQLLNVTAVIFAQSIVFMVGFIILILLDWRCMVAVVIAAVPFSMMVHKNQEMMKTFGREMRHSNSCLWGLVSQKLDAMKAIYAYGREKMEIINFFRLSSVMQRDALEQQRLGASIGRTAQLISTFATQGIFIYCTVRVLQYRMTLGEMMFIYGTAATLFGPVVAITQLSQPVSNLLVVLQRATQMLHNPNFIADKPTARPFPAPLLLGVQIQDMSFRYDTRSPVVLHNINVNIPVGQWLCIMGPSGAGKTTLVNLITRLYEPTTGRISIDDVPLDDIQLMSLRHYMTLVPQEAQIISGTIRNNITYGYPTATPREIMDAAKAADCHDFVMDLPAKYETIVGDKGVTLSGGQRQRISIARALITRPHILVLDDCTSALDANTERKIQETLTKQMVGKTAIIVSQRVSMAMRCDHIIVLEDGHITERGSHAHLIQKGGFYSRLYAQQTAGSRGQIENGELREEN